MMEPFFGSGSSLWTNAPYQGLGWLQMPMPIASVGNRGGLAGLLTDGAVGATARAAVAAVAMQRGQPSGPSNEQEIEDFIYDALELVPGANDVEVRCEAGRVTLSGNVQHKRIKREVGEVAWAIPLVSDVQNNLTIATRRRSRVGGRESETQPAGGPGRKTA
jgi:hypothetical protein